MANKLKLQIILRASMFLLSLAGLAQAATITVGSGAGYDFETIQAGIDAANDGDTILVAPGEYIITEPITFRGKAITVRSEAGPDETTILMGTPANPDRASVIVFENNETTASVLEGFTLTGGTGSRMVESSVPVNALVGGGIFFDASSGTVRNCTIVQNTTEHGGGIMCAYLCSPRLIDCTIERNLAEVSVGGVFTWGGCSMTLTNCIISGNSAIDGGGIQCWQNSTITMTDCIVKGNSATGTTVLVNGYGGGLYCGLRSLMTAINCNIAENSAGVGGGGVMCFQNSLATLIDCVITKNSARIIGGGIECTEGSITLTNCVIERNSSLSWGGGLSCHEPSSSVIVSNCSIWANAANQGGGGVGCFNGSSATVNKSIFWGNAASRGSEIFLEENPTEFNVTYCNVAGGRNGVDIEGGSTLNWGEGNIDADPLFVRLGYLDDKETRDPSDDVWMASDFHLKSQAGHWDPNSSSWVKDDVTSPCIDAGDPNSDWSGETWPHGERINMGAYGGTREASMSTRPEVMSLPRVAYVYDSEGEATESFRSLLMSYGCPTTLIGVDDVATAALDAYDLIVVASDAGYSSTWQDTPFVATIEDSDKPIIGLGQGGYNFFGVLELSIGRPNGGHGSKNSIEVVDPNCSLFSTPYPVDIPEDRALQLYTETDHIGIYLWPTIPETVTVLASEVNDKGYFPLVMEDNRYLLWGFTESPLKMTEVGKILFINVVIWTANAGWEIEI